jgi:hypothetical protein
MINNKNTISEISNNIVNSQNSNLEFQTLIEERKASNLIIANYANIPYEELTGKMLTNIDESKNEDKKEFTAKEIAVAVEEMNPFLSKILTIESLQNDFINKRHGAFMQSTSHCIKELLTWTDCKKYNKISDMKERLTAMSLGLIHDKLNESTKDYPEIKQSDFTKVYIDKKVLAFDLLPNHLQIKKVEKNVNIGNSKYKH